MNVITAYNAISLYPAESFIRKRSLVTSYLHPNQRIATQKYLRRGWQLHGPACAHRVDQLPYQWGELRRVGDSRSLVIPLYAHPITPNDPIMLNSWRLEPDYHATSFVQFEPTLEDDRLEFAYTVGNAEMTTSLTNALDNLQEAATTTP
jgi:hypothetical protein